MKIFINGNSKEVRDRVTIEELLKKFNIDSKRVVVLVNGERKQNDFKITDGMRIDIISFAGGG